VFKEIVFMSRLVVHSITSKVVAQAWNPMGNTQRSSLLPANN
jgi:hypothetical protein